VRSLAGLALAFALVVAPAWAKPPVWVAHGAAATVVLFGSVHILPGKLDWEPDALKAALADADELWFEVPIDPAEQMDSARLALARGMLPPGETLSALMPDDGARMKLAAAAQSLNLPMAQLERLRPWLAELTIAQASYAKDGAFADQGVERQLAAAAPRAQRHAFETVGQQIDMFAGAPVADQVASLQDTLREIQDDPGVYHRLTQAWLDGDLKAIDKDAVQPLLKFSPTLFKVLLSDRNAAWRRTLLQRLQSPGKVVVVVGVGHLIGPGGLPQLLREAGVRVDGPRP
jgi:uncharacterized protein YbaP (TraB family)